MQGGSMTQRENALPGLAGLLSMSLTKGGYQAARNGSFPQQGLPRVALMFLSRGALPYEPVWREFLEGIPDKHQGRSFSCYDIPFPPMIFLERSFDECMDDSQMGAAMLSANCASL